jgi:leader peptidase (prepilin peptidase)/N-methyltransferase
VSPPLIAVLALAGLLLGWPLRALIFRYAVPPGSPPRTGCPSCAHPPTSPPVQASSPAFPSPVPAPFGLRRLLYPPGRCPACRTRLGLPPLAVAISTAALFAALAARVHPALAAGVHPAPTAGVHPGLVLAAACWLAACAVPLVFIDAAVHRLPDVLTVPAYAGTVLLLLAAAATASPATASPATASPATASLATASAASPVAAAGSPWPVLLLAVLGGFALAGFYLVLLLVSPASMGLGDVKLAASLGTMLAWFGWRMLIAGGFAGFALAGLYGAALLVTHRATPKTQIPFGPFMIAGAFLVILIR